MPGVAESMSGSAIARWLMENPSLKWMIQRYPHFKPSYFNFESFISFILGIQSDLFISINWFSWQVRQVSTNPMSFVSILEHILILVSVLPGIAEIRWHQSLPMSYHFGYAKAYVMLARVEVFLTRSKLRKPLCEVLTRPCASEGFAYAKRVMTRPLLKM